MSNTTKTVVLRFANTHLFDDCIKAVERARSESQYGPHSYLYPKDEAALEDVLSILGSIRRAFSSSTPVASLSDALISDLCQQAEFTKSQHQELFVTKRENGADVDAPSYSLRKFVDLIAEVAVPTGKSEAV